MVDFYDEIEDILLEGPFKSKIEKFNTFLSKFESGDMDFVYNTMVEKVPLKFV
jgi:hypothetical protein